MDKYSNTVVVAGIASLVFLVGGWLVGNQPVEVTVVVPDSTVLGGLTNYDEVGTTEGYEVDNTQVIDGSGGYVGALNVSEESNQIGSINTYNPLYFGAGDGCMALLAAASGTLTTTATSTSFCSN